MFFRKITGIVLEKKIVKEADVFFYILSKQDGVLKVYAKGAAKWQNKNLHLTQPGTKANYWLGYYENHYKLLSGLILSKPSKVFKLYPEIYLWSLKVVKLANFKITSENLWYWALNLEKLIIKSPLNFIYWFLFHLTNEIGYGLDLKACSCGRKLIKAYVSKNELKCEKCHKQGEVLVKEKFLRSFRKIMSLKGPTNFYLNNDLKRLILRRFRFALGQTS